MAKLTKIHYLTVMLVIVMLALMAKHREFYFCEEKTPTYLEDFGAWLGLLEQPASCPGIEELYTMAMEMGLCIVAVLASTAIPSLLHVTKMASMINRTILTVKRGLLYYKKSILYRKQKHTAGDVPEENNPQHIKYHVFQNAYRQRKLVMLLRQGEGHEEILLYNPETMTVKRIA